MVEYLSKTMLRIRAGALRLAADVLMYRMDAVEVEVTDIGLAYFVEGISGLIPWTQIWSVDPELIGKRWMVDSKNLLRLGKLIPTEVFACETLYGNRGDEAERICKPLDGEELEETLAWSRIPVIYVMFRETGIEFKWMDSAEVTLLTVSVDGKLLEEP